MSWANPTSTESAVGVEVADEPGRRISRPAAAPNSSSPTAARTGDQRPCPPPAFGGGCRWGLDGHCIGAGASGATLAGVEPVSGSDPGVPGAGAAANGGGLSWSKAPGPMASQLAPTSGWVYWFCFSERDELVDAGVGHVADLELVAPGLQRDGGVEARVGRHHHVALAVDLLRQGAQRVSADLVRVVGDPDRAVLQGVHEVLAAHGGRVDDAVARGPVAVMRAAERRAVGVGDLLVRRHVLAARVLLGDDARDLQRRVLVLRGRRELGEGRLVFLLGPVRRVAVAEDADGEQDHHRDRGDGSPRGGSLRHHRGARVAHGLAALAADHRPSRPSADRPSDGPGVPRPPSLGAPPERGLRSPRADVSADVWISAAAEHGGDPELQRIGSARDPRPARRPRARRRVRGAGRPGAGPRGAAGRRRDRAAAQPRARRVRHERRAAHRGPGRGGGARPGGLAGRRAGPQARGGGRRGGRSRVPEPADDGRRPGCAGRGGAGRGRGLRAGAGGRRRGRGGPAGAQRPRGTRRGRGCGRGAVRARPRPGRRRPAHRRQPLLPRPVRPRPRGVAAPQRRRPRRRRRHGPAAAHPSLRGRADLRDRALPGRAWHRASRTASPATSRRWPAPSTTSTTPAGCSRGATRTSRTCTGRGWHWWSPRAGYWRTGSGCSASARRSGCEDSPHEAQAVADPAGPLHAGVLHPAESAGAHPGSAADLDALAPRGVAARNARRATTAWSCWPVSTSATSRSGTAPRCSSSTRTTSGRAAAEFAAAFGARRRVLRRQGVPVHRGRALGRRGGAAASTSAPAASSRVALRGGLPGRADRACTATTSRSPSCAAAVDAGVGRVVVDSFDEIDRLAAIAARARASARA